MMKDPAKISAQEERINFNRDIMIIEIKYE